MSARGRSVAVALPCLLLAGTLSGCASTPEQLGDALTQSISAVQTTRLALRTDRDGSSTFAVTLTAITDSVETLADAARSATALDLSRSADEKARQATLDLIRESTDDVNAARAALAGGRSVAQAQRHLGDVLPRLRAESESLRVQQ